jgi:hypothetical protein
MNAPSLLAGRCSTTGGALRAAALDVVAEGLDLMRELTGEEVQEVALAARLELERRKGR